MELLKKRILENGYVINNNILKVDSFLNHQIDVQLMHEIGKEFKRRFDGKKVTKIITVESSGIAPAVFTALEFGVDVVFARKHKSLTLNTNLLSADVFSFTKNEPATITVSKDYIKQGDSILIIDDFLANGEVIKGLTSVISQAGAQVCGVGIVIEKSFQKGRSIVDKLGVQTESLARIKSLDNNEISFL